jgi:CspA family cold shock protein
MEKGKIARLMTDKGYGFIAGANGKKIFFHHSSLEELEFEQLEDGQAIMCEYEDTPKGPRATKVTPGEKKRVFGAGILDSVPKE